MEKISEHFVFECEGGTPSRTQEWDLPDPQGVWGGEVPTWIADPVYRASCFISPCTLFAEPRQARNELRAGRKRGDVGTADAFSLLAGTAAVAADTTQQNCTQHIKPFAAKLYTYIRTEQKQPVATWAPRDARVQYSM